MKFLCWFRHKWLWDWKVNETGCMVFSNNGWPIVEGIYCKRCGKREYIEIKTGWI